jgi:hypothetical protein
MYGGGASSVARRFLSENHFLSFPRFTCDLALLYCSCCLPAQDRNGSAERRTAV